MVPVVDYRGQNCVKNGTAKQKFYKTIHVVLNQKKAKLNEPYWEEDGHQTFQTQEEHQVNGISDGKRGR
jgi:hypothetical protein